MQRERGELVPIGDALSGMGGTVQAIRDVTPQARHHFTQADQVNQLLGASEADPDLGFMARMLVLCSLPRTNPGNRLQYKRTNGPYSLIMTATGNHNLPFGNLPRLILAWVCTEAVRTQSREIVLGSSLSEFMRTLDVYSSSGRKYTRLRNQMRRLFNAHVRLLYEYDHGEASMSSSVADRTEFWWNERKPDERSDPDLPDHGLPEGSTGGRTPAQRYDWRRHLAHAWCRDHLRRLSNSGADSSTTPRYVVVPGRSAVGPSACSTVNAYDESSQNMGH